MLENKETEAVAALLENSKEQIDKCCHMLSTLPVVSHFTLMKISI
jgi:hypothetical protein